MWDAHLDVSSSTLARILHQFNTGEITTSDELLPDAEALDLLAHLKAHRPIGAIVLGRNLKAPVEILHGGALVRTLASIFTKREEGPVVCFDLTTKGFSVAIPDRNTLVPVWVMFQPRFQFRYEEALKKEGHSELAGVLDATGWVFKDYPVPFVTFHADAEELEKSASWLRRARG
jgi:hypothetical protein